MKCIVHFAASKMWSAVFTSELNFSVPKSMTVDAREARALILLHVRTSKYQSGSLLSYVVSNHAAKLFFCKMQGLVIELSEIRSRCSWKVFQRKAAIPSAIPDA